MSSGTLADWLAHFDVRLAALEKVGAMPGQGVVSMFTFGHAAGAVAGVLAALEVPVTLVTPQRWKKAAGLIGTDKDVVYAETKRLLTDQAAYDAMSNAVNPYGDGKASQRIVQAILHVFAGEEAVPDDFSR